MHLVYIDDSGDDQIACYSALIIHASRWNECDKHLSSMRVAMQKDWGVFLNKEIHARDFLGGRGRYAPTAIDVPTRVLCARTMLKWFTRMPTLQIINGVMDLAEKQRCFDWLMNRIDTNMRKANSEAMLISDHGKNYNAMLARKRKQNDIPSMFGDWGTGDLNANIPVTRIIERISYRDSASCLFIQAADLCAYSLLRKERPLAAKTALGIDTLFAEIDPVLVKAANGSDPHGIVRWYK